MTVEQKKQCLGGKGGFLYVNNMQVLLSYIHSVSSGVSDTVPVKVSYSSAYARINIFLGFIVLLAYVGFNIITFAVLPIGLACSFQAFAVLIFLLFLSLFYYGFYWQKHNGIVHLNSPPNPQQNPEPLIIILFRKFRHAIHR